MVADVEALIAAVDETNDIPAWSSDCDLMGVFSIGFTGRLSAAAEMLEEVLGVSCAGEGITTSGTCKSRS